MAAAPVTPAAGRPPARHPGPVSGGYGGSAGGGGNSTLYCQGDITTAFTWAGTAPVPQSVIVEQTCLASWSSSYCQAPVAGTCSNGLGGPASGTGPTLLTNGPGNIEGYDETGASGLDASGNRVPLYTVLPGAATLTLPTCNAMASITGSATAGPLTAGVSYSAAVYPVTIGGPLIKNVPQQNLGGATPGGNALEALTGQTISAVLNYSGPDTLSNLQWSTSGGSPFETWQPNTVPQYVPLSSGDADATGQTFTYNDAINGDSVTVKCTATVTLSDGTTQTVTATSAPVTFQKPTASWGVDPTTVPFIYQGDVERDPPMIGFLDMSPNYFGVSTWWYPVTISVPAPFSGGFGCFAQVVTPTATFTRSVQTTTPPPNPPPATSYSFKIQNAAGQWVLPGTGLDGAFPYGYGFAVDANGNVETTVSNGQVIPLKTNPPSSQFSGGGTGASGDAPSCPENPPDLDHGGTNWTSATWNDTFTTWLTYQPPGGVWIPLKKASSWSGSGNASGGPSNWKATGSYTAPSPTTVTGNASDFPQWIEVISGVTPHF